jgi:hypothetical protein
MSRHDRLMAVIEFGESRILSTLHDLCLGDRCGLGGACSARARGLIPAASYSDTGTPKVFRITESAVKATLLQVHSIVGLVIALLLTVIALTGVTMSFEDEI